MLRSTFLAFTLPAFGIATAQLTPERPATVGQHLLEVNAQWTAMEPSAFDDARIIHFDSDAERIAEHLHRVQQHLSLHTPAGIDPAAHAHRKTLLDALDVYADRGAFPMNDSVPGRSPVFIDAFGNACAVGHLMISSGHAELAERISREMNLAYVHAIALPEVADWAATNGFTTDELAWIQPTYDHMKHRGPLVLAAIELINGDRFEVHGPAGPEAAQKLSLLRMNATGTKVLTTLPMLTGVQAIEHNGHVFIGGMPPTNGPSAELYEWNGKSLVVHDPFIGRLAIGSLSVQNGTLHALGYKLGEGQPQERYLTEAGVWKKVEPNATAPVPGVVVPEERLP